MKKIYSKFVKERRKEFQIETALWNDNGQKYVSKRNLYKEGREHIDCILKTYNLYSKSGLICGAQKVDDKIVFEYIDGKTFENMLLSAMKRHNKQDVEDLIRQYNEIVEKICAIGGQETCENLEAAEMIFGVQKTDVEKYSDAIFDLTFDNLIFDGKTYKVIDYEWCFNFGVEKEFIKFRAAYAFIMKFKGAVLELYTTDIFYELFGVDVKNINRYLEYNNAFITYVYGQENYNDIIQKYEKISIELFEEETMGTLKTLQKRKSTGESSYEDVFFDKLLNAVEKNKDYYDDYTKFYQVTKKVRELTPKGYTESPEFVEEFSAYIDDLYGLVEFYKKNFELSKEQAEQYKVQMEQHKEQAEQYKEQIDKRKLRSILHRLMH